MFKDLNWFKIYLVIILAISLSFLTINILAQVEETQEILKDYLQDQACPNVVDANDLTFKDGCTGLVWARYELPTYKVVNDPNPGYTWQEAKDNCASLASANLFRLPTVEELLSLVNRYKCGQGECLAKSGVITVAGQDPVFSGGVYWAISDFNEPVSWITLPDGNAERNYKRSVNLLNGSVDSPVFGPKTKLNALCIVNRNAEIIEKKFISTTTGSLTNGMQITDGQLKTDYHRQCDPNNDTCAQKITGTTCSVTPSYCSKTETVTIAPRVVICNTGYHIESTSCQPNSYGGKIWFGNMFNGYMYQTCGNGVLDSGEQCDGLVNVATTPSESSATKKYVCVDCQFPADAGYLGDSIVNGPEMCDTSLPGQSCTTDYNTDLPTYCASIPVAGTEDCNGGVSWGDCVAAAPTLTSSSSTACNSTSPTLNDYACCKLVSCGRDGCNCCGRSEGALDIAGYTTVYTLPPCPAPDNNNGCKLGQSTTNNRNWVISTNHTTATYQCWH